MIDLKEFLTPTFILFFIIVIGSVIGKIKILNVSFSISGVLIISVLFGLLISELNPQLINTELENTLNFLSQFGTALFVASIGLSAGVVTKEFSKTNGLFFLMGVFMVCISFFSMKTIELTDTVIDKSLLLGILCGAMTTTPGLLSVCETPDFIAENAVLGYGCSYLFGVIGIIIFVQIISRNIGSEEFATIENKKQKYKINWLIPISSSAILGQIIGKLRFPLFNIFFGTSGGILCVSIIIGMLLQKRSAKESNFKDLSIYRDIGLIMFFVGTGLTSGENLNIGVELKWFIYGIILTVIPIIFGYICSRYLLKHSKENSICIVSGGMTSTPAIGVLLKNQHIKLDLSGYSFSYIGALLTMVIGVKFL